MGSPRATMGSPRATVGSARPTVGSPRRAATLLWAFCTQFNVWPGANLGLNLTGVVCY